MLLEGENYEFKKKKSSLNVPTLNQAIVKRTVPQSASVQPSLAPVQPILSWIDHSLTLLEAYVRAGSSAWESTGFCFGKDWILSPFGVKNTCCLVPRILAVPSFNLLLFEVDFIVIWRLKWLLPSPLD